MRRSAALHWFTTRQHKAQLLKLAMSGASERRLGVGRRRRRGVRVSPRPILNDDATVATAATAATVPAPTTSHEEAVARGQLMAATASADAAEIRPFDRLPDDGLAKVLAILKQSEHRRVESVCQRWRQIRPRASLARIKSLRFRRRVVTLVARRFRNNQEDYYSTDVDSATSASVGRNY